MKLCPIKGDKKSLYDVLQICSSMLIRFCTWSVGCSDTGLDRLCCLENRTKLSPKWQSASWNKWGSGYEQNRDTTIKTCIFSSQSQRWYGENNTLLYLFCLFFTNFQGKKIRIATRSQNQKISISDFWFLGVLRNIDGKALSPCRNLVELHLVHSFNDRIFTINIVD